MLSLKEIVLVGHVTLVKPNVMRKLDGMNIIIQSSEPSKHHQSNINHYFTWAVISNAPKNTKTRKNLEASYIALWKPDLNEQKDFERLVLFRNGVNRGFNDIMQAPKTEVHFFFFSLCCIVFNRS